MKRRKRRELNSDRLNLVCNILSLTVCLRLCGYEEGISYKEPYPLNLIISFVRREERKWMGLAISVSLFWESSQSPLSRSTPSASLRSERLDRVVMKHNLVFSF